jgi:hypothetical protein
MKESPDESVNRLRALLNKQSDALLYDRPLNTRERNFMLYTYGLRRAKPAHRVQFFPSRQACLDVAIFCAIIFLFCFVIFKLAMP